VLEVGLRTLSFTDPSRKTYNYTTGATLASRTVGVEIRYPTYAGAVGTEALNVAITHRKSYPLILFAPGYRLRAEDYLPLLDSWVKAGFLVAALQFPDTTYPASEPPYAANLPHNLPEADMYNEPADVAFALRQLEDASTTKGNWLHGLIDPTEVALAGHSDGGNVVAAVVYDKAYQVAGINVRAVAVLSGSEFAIANQSYSQPSSPGVPLLVVQSAADTCNPPDQAVQLYNAIGAPKYFLELDNATHLGAYDGTDPAASSIVEKTTASFFSNAFSSNTTADQALLTTATQAGISSLTDPSLAAPIATPPGSSACPVN
jgi:predicted dienelactone hydrolase